MINPNPISIFTNSKIYVACPAHTATGGPELLQQLVFHLRKDLGLNAFIYYYPSSCSEPIHPDYLVYDNPYCDVIEDSMNNLLIVPESKPTLALLVPFKNIRKAIWWLSIDNYYLSHFLASKKNGLLKRAVNKLCSYFSWSEVFEIRLTPKIEKRFSPLKNPIVISADFHFTNSYRGMEYLINLGLTEVKYLSEYLNLEFLSLQTNLQMKKDIVAYNPKKGNVFTQILMQKAPDITFIPIENLGRDEVISLLQKAKVYIDFGNHPGKDRLPREAAILQCCVITGKRGSAGNSKDVAIPENYKFDDSIKSCKAILGTIRQCFHSYEKNLKYFEEYRSIIRDEPQQFIYDLKSLFVYVE
ncbi:MAG: hypothetical protein IE909_10715 [Campylobacterales bacterium]|nr:hypothetical protein [Campylobacterales bacterium]